MDHHLHKRRSLVSEFSVHGGLTVTNTGSALETIVATARPSPGIR